MCKKVSLLVVCLGLVGSAWAGFGDPYIGEEAIGWQTTSAVTITAGSRSAALGDPDQWPATNIINGGAFEANGAPGSKVPFPGAPYTTDGVHHTYNIVGNGWRANSYYISGLPHPTGRPAGGGVYSQNWLSFEFDKPYFVTSIDIWNGSYAGGVGGPGDWSFRDVYIDYKVNGNWQMAATTIRLHRIPDLFAFFAPTDNIVVGKDNVTQVVITPINNWAEDCSWDPGCTGGYLDPQAAVSEVRFYIPPPPSLAVAVAGTNITVFWPTNVVGYSLESSAVLGTGASWNAVSGVVDNSLTITNPNGNQFYRLKK